MINLYKAFNKLHDIRGNCILTPFNYAVNDRCYDPTKKGVYLSAVNSATIHSSAGLANPPYVATLGIAVD